MQTANVLCVCEDGNRAGTKANRHIHTIERLCLEARLRHKISGLSQVLVLMQPDSKVMHISPSPAHEVMWLQTCDTHCISSNDIIKMLSHGFDRAFLQLATHLSMLSDQLDMADEVGRQRETHHGLTLFQTPEALNTLLAGASGEATTEPSILPLLTIADQGCTLCGTCSWVCPTSALRLSEDGETLDIRDSLCTSCSICVAACPEQVLMLTSEHKDLTVQAHHNSEHLSTVSETADCS